MASRKTSRGSKTSTTARRENLLRSVVAFVPGHRMSTNGLFRLGSQTLTEVNQLTGRSRFNSYFVVRGILRDALLLAQNSPSAENFVPTFYTGSSTATRFRVRVTPETISIGCKTFTGKDADVLKAWALKE